MTRLLSLALVVAAATAAAPALACKPVGQAGGETVTASSTDGASKVVKGSGNSWSDHATSASAAAKKKAGDKAPSGK